MRFAQVMKTVATVLVILLCLAVADAALAQALRERPPGEDVGEACGTCCGGGLFIVFGSIVLVFLWFAINIVILFWVAKDAKSRNMDGAMWIFLILFTGFLGLAIYLFSRPQGVLSQCRYCGNNRLQVSAICPHCGNK